MISSLIIFRQIQYIKNKNIGFNREQVMVMNVADQGLRENFEAFKYDLQQNPDIIDMTTSSQIPTNIGSATGAEFLTDDGQRKLVHYQYIGVDYNFIDVFKMNILAGRNFSKSFGTLPSPRLYNMPIEKLASECPCSDAFSHHSSARLSFTRRP